MRGYEGINLPLSACVHFVRNHEIRDSIETAFQDAQRCSVVCVYVDYLQVAGSAGDLVEVIASLLHLNEAPYPAVPWVPFLDDLITLSNRLAGLVIVIDNAELLLEKDRECFFDFVEAFLIQFHHWFEKKKPCHLCFQMQSNDALRRVFSTNGMPTILRTV